MNSVRNGMYVYRLLTRMKRTCYTRKYKKAQLSLTNPLDAKACQKLLQFDVLT